MSIRMISALPGHGKGRFMTEEIVVSRLAHTKRVVVTSMTELRPDNMALYLAKHYPKVTVDLTRRLFFIPKDEVATFYRYRGHKTYPKPPSLPLHSSIEEKDKAYEEYFATIDREGQHVGVDYFLTEAHRHFKADTWKEMGHVTTFYFSQHRHLDDNIWIETQWPKMVVVQLRDLTEETILIRNHYKESFAFFKKPGCFRIFRYYGCPKNFDSAEPYHAGAMELDREGLASCYYTRGALGERQTGVEADTSRKALPFWTVIPLTAALIALVITALFYVPKFGIQALGAWMRQTGKATEKAIATATDLDAAPPASNPRPTPQEQPKQLEKPKPLELTVVQPSAAANAPVQDVYATGLLYGRRGVIAVLSDGTRESTSKSVINEVRINGRTLQFKAKAEPPREAYRPATGTETPLPSNPGDQSQTLRGRVRAEPAPAPSLDNTPTSPK